MPAVYIANYATMASAEAEMDDPAILDGTRLDALKLMASPQAMRVSLDFTDAWVQQCKADLIFDAEGDLIFDTEEPLELKWETDGWQRPADGRPYQKWLVKNGDDVVGMLVVQRIDAAS